MLKLVVFDCDGVLFDSREANRRYYNDLLAAFGKAPMSTAQLDFVHMHSVTESIACIFAGVSPGQLAEVHRFREQQDYSPYLEYMVMEPDLIDFLQFARQRCQLAISTNRTTTMRPLLRAFNIDRYFDMVVTAADVPHPKPAPDALLTILAHFTCPAAEAIFIGDSLLDHYHAEAAGVRLIAFRNEDLPAAFHVRSFAEIRALPPFTG